MKNILVPTDFSENSKSAFNYALELAERFEAKVTVIHVYHPSLNTANSMMVYIDEELEKINSQQLDQFVASACSDRRGEVIVANQIDKKIILGYAVDKIVELSESEDYDLIVMGATGKTGFLEKTFGKVSSAVAKQSKCPVLLIPANTKFEPIKKIMYASEYESADESILLKIDNFSKKMNSEVHLVHVYGEEEQGENGPGYFLLEKVFQLKAPTLEFEMGAITSDTVANGLEKYAEINDMDWMVIVKPHRKFWERILHRSRTNEIIMNPQIPLMIMH